MGEKKRQRSIQWLEEQIQKETRKEVGLWLQKQKEKEQNNEQGNKGKAS